MGHPTCWGTHIEILAVASLYQVPVYYVTDPPQSDKGHKWELVCPISPASIMRYPLVVEDDPTYASFSAKPTHFELAYYTDRHYNCIVSKDTNELCSIQPNVDLLQSNANVDLTTE